MNDPTFKPRLWPAVVIITLAAIVAGSTPFLFTRTIIHFVGLIGAPIIAAILIPIWWLTFSRVTGPWRWWPVLAYSIPAIILWTFVYRGEFKLPYQGEEVAMLLYIMAPIAALWVVWLAVSRRTIWHFQRMGLLIVLLTAHVLASLVRIDGADAAMVPALRWVWQRKPSFDHGNENGAQPRNVTIEVTPDDWAEFRGPQRDNVVRNLKINFDWDKKPPKELWRRPVGPGWGSFSIVDERAFTQEQRGPDEAVVCYHAVLGHQLWEWRTPARFTEFIAKEGPRSTPMIANGKLFAFGATGKLCCLDAATGEQIWLRDIPADHGATVPQWGYAASPLVIDGRVIVFSAVKGKAVVAYRADTGEPLWANGNGQHGYSSAHKVTLHGVEQVLMVSDFGLESFLALNGKKLWEYDYFFKGQNRTAQPTILPDGDIILGTAVGDGQGARRIHIDLKNGNWDVKLVWTARGPKPYFNDGVIHKGHYYGFDDRNFVCVDVKDGKIKWNARDGYAFGQVILIVDQHVLLIQSEKGPVALVRAMPDEYDEIAKLPALKDKTWNHPVLCRGRLYLRNNVEAVCYDLNESK